MGEEKEKTNLRGTGGLLNLVPECTNSQWSSEPECTGISNRKQEEDEPKRENRERAEREDSNQR